MPRASAATPKPSAPIPASFSTWLLNPPRVDFDREDPPPDRDRADQHRQDFALDRGHHDGTGPTTPRSGSAGVAECFDPATGEKVELTTIPGRSGRKDGGGASPAQPVVIAFKVARPDKLDLGRDPRRHSRDRVIPKCSARGRTAAQERRGTTLGDEPAGLELWRIDDPPAAGPSAAPRACAPASSLFVQDRLVLHPGKPGAVSRRRRKVRCISARVKCNLFAEAGVGADRPFFPRAAFAAGTGRTFRAATPPLFSFNSPLGACPTCRGFGRIIEIDYRLAIPDSSLSIEAGAIKCWEGKVYSESKRDLLVFARKLKIPTNVPFAALNPEQQAYVINGEDGYGEENGKTWPKHWYGIKGFFRYL